MTTVTPRVPSSSLVPKVTFSDNGVVAMFLTSPAAIGLCAVQRRDVV
jgi:hypothetical protein